MILTLNVPRYSRISPDFTLLRQSFVDDSWMIYDEHQDPRSLYHLSEVRPEVGRLGSEKVYRRYL